MTDATKTLRAEDFVNAFPDYRSTMTGMVRGGEFMHKSDAVAAVRAALAAQAQGEPLSREDDAFLFDMGVFVAHATGNRASKPSTAVSALMALVDEHIEDRCEEAVGEALSQQPVAWKPTEQQILDAAEKAGLWPNTVHSWMPAFNRFFDHLALTAPQPAAQAVQPVAFSRPYGHCSISGPREDVEFILRHLPDVDDPQPVQPVAQWQPIETAPKDGRLLLWWGGSVVFASWLDNSLCKYPWAGWQTPSLTPRPPGEPTHWMPLPAAPGAAPTVQPVAVPECHVAVIGHRWVPDEQYHVPQLLIEFNPVPANSPSTAQGWVDRDALAAILAAAAKGGA